MRCTWCNVDAEEAAARHEEPHLKWCVHWRDPGLPEGMTVEIRNGQKVHHYRSPPGSPLSGMKATVIMTDGLTEVDSGSGSIAAHTRCPYCLGSGISPTVPTGEKERLCGHCDGIGEIGADRPAPVHPNVPPYGRA